MNRRFQKKYPRASKAIQIGGKVARVASVAYKTAMAVASLINAEFKSYDIYTNNVIGTAGRIELLTGMDGGTTDVTRTGDSIMMKSEYVKGMWQRNASATVPTYVRSIIVRDMNDNSGTPPTLAEILNTTIAPQSLFCPHNKDNTERFQVLYDKTKILDAYHNNVQIKYYKAFKMGKDKQGRPIKAPHCTFNSGTGTDTSKGHLYLVSLCSDNTNTATFLGYSRFTYIDN